MSLVNEYRSELKRQLGLKEEDPMATSPTPATTADMGGDATGSSMGGMDEATLNNMLELINREIAKREAVGAEAMEDPAAKHVGVPEVPSANSEGCMKEAEMLADDIYFEMLNTFKNNIANCDDAGRKEMYRKGYNYLYKMRDKFIKEMTACDEQPAPVAAVPAK